MSDKFFNTYVDFAIGTIHEQLAIILQLKTQLKIANDLVLEKDGVINTLTQEKEDFVSSVTNETNDLRQQVSTIDGLRNTINGLTAENESLKVKASHTDTCLNQVAEMKKEIVSRDQKIQEYDKELLIKDNIIKELKEEIEKLKASQDTKLIQPITELKPKEIVINKKDTKKKETNSLDDF